MNKEDANKNPELEINFFDDERFQFLSNMYPCTVKYKGLTYQTSEAAFQANKFKNKEYQKMFTNFKSDGREPLWKSLARPAKTLGGPRGKICKKDPKAFDKQEWDSGRAYKVMKEVVRAKFTQNEDLKEKLLATGNANLIEGTTWNDRIWGVDLATMKGKNQLGKILMEVRDELTNKTTPIYQVDYFQNNHRLKEITTNEIIPWPKVDYLGGYVWPTKAKGLYIFGKDYKLHSFKS